MQPVCAGPDSPTPLPHHAPPCRRPRALPPYLIKVPHEVDAFFPRTLLKGREDVRDPGLLEASAWGKLLILKSECI